MLEVSRRYRQQRTAKVQALSGEVVRRQLVAASPTSVDQATGSKRRGYEQVFFGNRPKVLHGHRNRPIHGGMRTRNARLLVAFVAAVVMFTVLPAGSASAAEAPSLTITGRGWGHGRGLGQYGALGLAQDHGWSSAQILDHFYGGTVAGAVPASAPVNPNAVRVDLRYNHGNATHVGLEVGKMTLTAPGWGAIGVYTGAVRLSSHANGFEVATAASCAGPWTVAQNIEGLGAVDVIPSENPADRTGLLHVCRAGGAKTWYSGTLQATTKDGSRRTVNVTTIEEYLRGVVPNESPSRWPLAALEAQAVAARSYAMAGDTRQLPYADTCETTRCQVYGGRFHQRAGAGIVPMTNPRTDAAIAATTGLVRINGAGGVARTEFSSSTGGFTAGGTFPSVEDPGDSVADNPNKNWTKVVDVVGLERRFGLGQLVSVVPTSRNGLGADGGRVLTVDFNFTGGTVTQPGWTARTTLGMKSDWFVPGEVIRPVAQPDYTVAPGDTLSKIGKKLGINWQEIAARNGISAPFTLKVGQQLALPGSPAPAPAPAATPPPPAPPPPAPAPAPVPARTYTVVPGDTLSKIGRKLGINWKSLAEANGLAAPWNIRVGQVLTVPGTGGQVIAAPPATTPTPASATAKTYTVRPGDTLGGIGYRTGVPWRTIAEKNGLSAPYVIKIGQTLSL